MAKAFTIPSIFTAIDRFSAPVARMQGAVGRFASTSATGLAFAERGFRRLVSPITALNNAMMGFGLYVGLYSFINAFRGALKIMGDFQQMQVNISTVVDKNQRKDMPALGESARRTALQYGKAAAEVSELQFQLIKLGNTPKDVLNMAAPISAGATGFGTTPERTADLVGGVMKGLGDDSSMTAKRMSQILYAADQTAADFESMATQLPIVTGIAAMQKVPFETILAYLGTLRNYQIHTATGSTSLKNIILDLAKKGKDIKTGLMEVASQQNAVVYANKAFGKKSVVTAVALSREIQSVEELSRKIAEVPETFAEELAAKRLNSFQGAVSLAKSAYAEFILSIEDGTGKYAKSLQHMMKVVSAMFLLSSNSTVAKDALKGMDDGVIQAAYSQLDLISKIWLFIKAMIVAKAVLLLWRGIVMAATIVQGAWSVAMAISAAAGLTNKRMLIGNTVAMAAYRAIVSVATIGQWGLNAAQYASPLIILAVGILAAVGVMKIMNNWVDSLTGGFLNMSGAVDGYNDSLNKMPTLKEIPMPTGTFGTSEPTDRFAVAKTMGDSAAVETINRAFWRPREEREADVAQIVSRKPSEEEVSKLAELLNGKIEININDPGGVVKDAKSSNSMISVKTGSTFGMQKKSD